MDSVLVRKNFVDRQLLKTRSDEETDEVGDHQRNEDGIISRDFKNHHHAGHWRTDNSSERRPHANERVRARSCDLSREEMVSNRADDATEHRPEKNARPKNSAGV